jgi:hypothetical protein
MITGLLLCAVLSAAPATDDAPPEAIQKYLADCESGKSAAIAAQEAAIRGLKETAQPQQLKEAQLRLKQLKESPAALLPLQIPPAKEGIGVFAPASPVDGRGGRSVDVLQVIDEDDAILRVWYAPPPSSADKSAPPEDPTFVDLWAHGIDTSELKANQPARLSQVFQVTGSKTFDTTCGGRSMTLLEPVEVERYRSATKK